MEADQPEFVDEPGSWQQRGLCVIDFLQRIAALEERKRLKKKLSSAFGLSEYSDADYITQLNVDMADFIGCGEKPIPGCIIPCFSMLEYTAVGVLGANMSDVFKRNGEFLSRMAIVAKHLIRCVKNTEFQKQWIRYIKCRQEYGEANDTKWVPLRDNICKILISNLKVTEDRNPNEEMRKSHFRLNDLPDFMERFSDN